MASNTDRIIRKLIIKKDKLKPLNNEENELLLGKMRKKMNLYKEDVIYEAKNSEFFKGDSHDIRIINRLNLITNCSRTIARIVSSDSTIIERTSDSVSSLIGAQNYETVFSALCSVISQELKVRGIFSLLTVPKAETEKSCQTPKKFVDSSCQTEESLTIFLNKRRKRIRRQLLTPYVVKESSDIKKVVVNPTDFLDSEINSVDSPDSDKDIASESLPNLKLPNKLDDDDDSNWSLGNVSALSIETLPNLIDNPTEIFNNVDKHTKEVEVTNPFILTMADGTEIKLITKPEDPFHYVAPHIMKHLTPEQRLKVHWHQAQIDWNYCLHRDEDNNLPLHNAVLGNDTDLLRRHCVIIRAKGESIDIPASGQLSALRMSLYQDNTQCTSLLVHHGANPLLADEEGRSPLHLAAELSTEHLATIVNGCRANPKLILQQNEVLWRPDLENKSKEELTKYLLYKMCIRCDNQGYTPLMLAAKLGRYTNVRILIQAAPDTINMPMPNSGNTALYIAVGAACLDAIDRCNRSLAADHFMKTIELLIENGADPVIDNHSGSNVNTLLSEFNMPELSVLIAKKLTSVKFFNGDNIDVTTDAYILVKDEEGKVNLNMKIKNEVKVDEKNCKTEIVPVEIKSEVVPLSKENVRSNNAKLNEDRSSDNISRLHENVPCSNNVPRSESVPSSVKDVLSKNVPQSDDAPSTSSDVQLPNPPSTGTNDPDSKNVPTEYVPRPNVRSSIIRRYSNGNINIRRIKGKYYDSSSKDKPVILENVPVIAKLIPHTIIKPDIVITKAGKNKNVKVEPNVKDNNSYLDKFKNFVSTPTDDQRRDLVRTRKSKYDTKHLSTPLKKRKLE